MHDPSAEGNDFFKCDFCLVGWSDENPMVGGHQGSLICARCLTAAYGSVVHSGSPPLPDGGSCTMCLEDRTDPCWRSTDQTQAVVCLRCIKQAARVLEKDADLGWKRPETAG
jgi:hypothetical protein